MIRLSDVSVLGLEWPDDISLPPKKAVVRTANPATIKLLAALVESDNFQEFVQDLRDEHLDGNPCPVSLLLEDKGPEFVDSMREFMSQQINGLLSEFELSRQAFESIFALILCNAFYEIDEEEFPDITMLRTPAEVSEYLQDIEEDQINVSMIAFTHKLTKNQFHKWLDENWKFIDEQMNTLLPAPALLPDKIQNIALLNEMYELYRSGKTSSQISEILMNKYPQYPFVYDEGWVSNKLSHYRTWIRKNNSRFKIPAI